MLLKYKKMTAKGEVIGGEREFLSIKEAQEVLTEAGDLLLELKSIKRHKQPHLNLAERFEFTYQMHQLISAGLPIYESLISLQEKKVKYLPLLIQLSQKIKEGTLFSQALKQFPECFDSLYISIIQAAEATGEIKEGFLALKNLLEKQAKLIKILKNALIYPSILCVFAFLIVNALIFFIIPSLKELFEGRQVTGLTAGILFISNWCVNHVNLLLCLMVLTVGIGIYAQAKGLLKRVILKVLNFIPFCESLFLSLKFENFFSCLHLLLSRGINLKEALVLAKNVLGYEKLEILVEGFISDILEGKKLSESIRAPFPSVVKRLIGLSEVTGKTSFACEMLSVIFQEEVEKKLHQLTTFLQPLLLAFIGLVVGLVVLSILMPLTDIGSFI